MPGPVLRQPAALYAKRTMSWCFFHVPRHTIVWFERHILCRISYPLFRAQSLIFRILYSSSLKCHYRLACRRHSSSFRYPRQPSPRFGQVQYHTGLIRHSKSLLEPTHRGYEHPSTRQSEDKKSCQRVVGSSIRLAVMPDPYKLQNERIDL